MQLIPVIPSYQEDVSAQVVWDVIKDHLGSEDGLAFYRHPNLGPGNGLMPDFALLAENYGVVAVRVMSADLGDVEIVDSDTWSVKGKTITSPILELEDIRTHLEYRFNQDRRIRGMVSVSILLAWLNIKKSDYCQKFGAFPDASTYAIWQNHSENILPSRKDTPKGDLWRLCKSVFQSVSPLNQVGSIAFETTNRLGPAIRLLERNIALLDDRQEKVAYQIPPGPQRIRGLAGTGKTVLLAMKAANIHSHFPDAKVLFTFNTQSLYNQARELITKFYRVNKPSDPDWSRLHIRHGWGSSSRSGVYSDICARQGVQPLHFKAAQSIDRGMPFRACCKSALMGTLTPEYDFILVDEAQDFPKDFFLVLSQLTKGPEKKIYFAYDELQSLTHTEIPNAEDLFGLDPDGKPLVDLQGEYPGGMDKDLVLFKSYRCPHEVLMLAHGIGLGVHNTKGCVQMISKNTTWTSIGYEIVDGRLEKGKAVTIRRPPENSPNNIGSIYKGDQATVLYSIFDEREKELQWVADSVAKDIRDDGVSPEDIIVISLDSLSARQYMSLLQGLLVERGIASVVPGLVDPADEFAEEGRVTLSTVYRAKGNEAPVVYIISFDSLYDYVREVEMRNRAFTSISRAKGWVRISGCGKGMKRAAEEISHILADIPCFKFIFPDMTRIERNLDAAEADRRRKEVRAAERSVRELAEVDIEALSNLHPSDIAKVLDKLRHLQETHGDNN